MDGPAIATTARRERGLAAMLLLLRVDLPRAVPATATRAEREDAMTVDMLADVMVRGRRMPVCVGGAASAVVTAVASVRQTVGKPREAGRRQGAHRLKKHRLTCPKSAVADIFEALRAWRGSKTRHARIVRRSG